MCPTAAGVYARTPLTINIAGIAALAPQMAGQVQANPALSGMMFASINEDAVPLEEGWVKLRGLEPQVTKDDILRFFEVGVAAQPQPSCRCDEQGPTCAKGSWENSKRGLRSLPCYDWCSFRQAAVGVQACRLV